MKTDAEFHAWARSDDKHPVALYNFTVGRAGVEVPVKVSRLKYRHAAYEACVERGLVTSEKITPEGAARLAAGQVIVGNLDGKRDFWLRDVWANRPFEVLVGDLRWPLEDFHVKFRGIVENCTASEDGATLIISTLDRTKQLDAPVSEVKLADGTHCPTALGECVNVTPKYDAATQSWVYHSGAAAGLVAGEARVEGRPRTTVTQNAAAGRFQFQTNEKNIGAITCSVWGDATGGIYRNTIASLVRLIVTAYGKTAGRYTDADIDLANFDAFDLAHPQPVGQYLAERENCAVVIAKFASSVQAQLLPSLLGPLRLIQWGVTGAPTASIRPADYEIGSLKRGAPLPVVAAVKIAYCRNYSPQQPQSSLPDEHKALFAAPWRAKDAISETARDDYRLTTDTAQIETCFTNGADAQAEANRRRDNEETPRVPYTVDCFPQALQHAIGQVVTLYGDRYDLDDGKVGQITGRETDFDTLYIKTEVTI